MYKRQSIGCAEDFIRVREQIRGRRYRLQKQLSMVKGGKGRDKKLRALDLSLIHIFFTFYKPISLCGSRRK